MTIVHLEVRPIRTRSTVQQISVFYFKKPTLPIGFIEELCAIILLEYAHPTPESRGAHWITLDNFSFLTTPDCRLPECTTNREHFEGQRCIAE
jgi:hypothetical protein